MKKFFMSIFLLLFAISSVELVQADDNALRQVFEGRYASMKSAMADRDGKAVSLLLAPDFTSIDVSGQSTNATQMIQELNTLPKDPLKISNTKLLSIKVSDKIALIDQRYEMKSKKIGPDSSKRDIELVTVSTDTWINSNGVWLVQRTMTNQVDYFVNGQLTIHKIRTAKP